MWIVLNMNPTLCGPDQNVLTGDVMYGRDKWIYCTRKVVGLYSQRIKCIKMQLL